MPRGGSLPGERRGGRKAGTPNKKNVAKREQEREARQIAAQVGGDVDPVALAAAIAAAKARRFDGFDEMVELAKVLKSYVVTMKDAAVNSGLPALPTKENPNPSFNPMLWDMFKDWWEGYASLCDRIASYQRPKMKAVAVVAPMMPGDDAKVVNPEAEVKKLNQPGAATKVYMQVVKGGKAA